MFCNISQYLFFQTKVHDSTFNKEKLKKNEHYVKAQAKGAT